MHANIVESTTYDAITCYEVLANTDTVEGRGSSYVVARFYEKSVAIDYMTSPAYAKLCVMGIYHSDMVKSQSYLRKANIVINKTSQITDAKALKDLAIRALNNLSAAEIDAIREYLKD